MTNLEQPVQTGAKEMRHKEEQLIDGYADGRCADPDGNHEGGCSAALEAERLINEIKVQVWDDALNESHAEGEWCDATRTTCFDNHNPYRS